MFNTDISNTTPFAARRLLKDLMRFQYADAFAGRTTAQVCRPILKAAVSWKHCILAYVKVVDPQRGRLILIADECASALKPLLTDTSAGSPSKPPNFIEVLDVATSLTGLSVETRDIEYFDNLRVPRGDRSFQDTKLLNLLPPTASLLTIPIRNIGNKHQVLLVISLYFDVAISITPQLIEFLDGHASLLATAVESNLRERTYRASLSVSQRLGRRTHNRDAANKNDYDLRPAARAFKVFVECVRRETQADQVALFIEDRWSPTRLICRAITSGNGSRTYDVAAHSPAVPSIVVDVLKRNREYLAYDGRSNANSSAADHGLRLDGNVLILPLHDTQGQCMGAIACARDRAPANSNEHTVFTYDDVAVVGAMEQAFAAPLETLVASDQRTKSATQLTHELRVPLTAFGAVLERMETECREADFRFSHKHFDEAFIYIDLMNRVLKELDVFSKGPSNIKLVYQMTKLYNDVVKPSQRFVAPILYDYGFKPYQLSDQNFPQDVTAKVDAGVITQILFNLLDNAIKYYPQHLPREQFACAIEAYHNRRADSLEIRVRDNGAKIPAWEQERIFEFGYRGADACESDVLGSGLGLWICRALASKHGGKLELRDCEEGKEFVLSFPFKPYIKVVT